MRSGWVTVSGTRWMVSNAVFVLLVIVAGAKPVLARTIDFEDVALNGGGVGEISIDRSISAYAGLTWNNFQVQNISTNRTTGFYYSAPNGQGANFAFNMFGDNASFLSSNVAFNFNSAYLTGAFNNGMGVIVEGYGENGQKTYSQNITVNAGHSGVNPTLYKFDFAKVNIVAFVLDRNHEGTPDTSYIGKGAGTYFALDNITITAVPLPVAVWTGLALLSGLANARAETLAEKPSFKTALRRRHCLILASGFYEWRKELERTAKTPMYITLASGRPMAFAGLWDTWHDPKGGAVSSCTIITTTPNDLMRPIHNRMPAILHEEHYRTWLLPDEQPAEQMLELLGSYPAELMAAHPVSPLVNSPRNDSPGCVQSPRDLDVGSLFAR